MMGPTHTYTFTTANSTHQLVTPHSHRNNLAKRAIQIFRLHFKADLASVDPTFPLLCWDLLLDQAELALNLLRGSQTNQKLSA